MDLDWLRAETRAEHQAVEALLPLMDAGLTRERYAAVLQRMYRVVHAWETWAAANAPAHLSGEVRERRRDHLLRNDLQALGQNAEEGREPGVLMTWAIALDSPETPPPVFEAAFLGAMYVMEGSRLGGQLIARHVEDVLGLLPGCGDAYFRGYEQRTGTMWQDFKALLRAVPEEFAGDVLAAAKAMFGSFGEAFHDSSAA